MLTGLQVTNFRKFDRYAVDFGDRNLLVGPNNAGKSTLIEALRLVSIVVNRFGSLNFDSPPEWLEAIERSKGVTPSLRGLDFDLGREIFHQYADPPAILKASFTGGSTATIYVGAGADVFAVVRDADDVAITTKAEARLFDQPRIGIQPQVGPLSRVERPLADRYVKGSLDSTLAPTHFRNQLRLLDHRVEAFKQIAERTWSELRIDGVELVGRGDELHLELFVRDGPFVGEVAAMGHGLQMWLQLMWFLARSSGDGTIVLDEPDVYMHPDLQRRLVRFLLSRDQQVVIATHSIEMMSEVEPHELVPIDSSRASARRARDLRDVQQVVEQVGGVHNIEFARLSRAQRYLIAPRADLRLLKRIHDLIAPKGNDALDLMPMFPADSWEDWPYAVAMKRAIEAVRDEPVTPICLLPPGLASKTQIELRRREAADEGIDLHIWERRTLMNYLLAPSAIGRAARGSDQAKPSDEAVAAALEMVLAGFKSEVASEHASAMEFAEPWETLLGRLALVPGRLALLRLSGRLRKEFGCSVGAPDVLRVLAIADLSPEPVAVLEAIQDGRSVAEAGASTRDSAEWAGAVSDEQGVTTEAREEILDLFEDAGVFASRPEPLV